MSKNDKGEYAAPVKKADAPYREFKNKQKRKVFEETERKEKSD